MHALVIAAALHSQRISGTEIAQAASRALGTLAREQDRSFVPATAIADQIISADGPIRLRAQSPEGSASFVNVPVQIEVAGHLDRTVLVGYRVERLVETAVAARDLAPGTVLSADDLEMSRVPYTGRDSNGIDVLVGRKLYSPTVKGTPVGIAQTQVNQIVKAGATVMFMVRNGDVVVSGDAVARTGGGLGEQVFVYNLLTRKSLSGTVIAPGVVELDISGGTP